MNSKKFQVEQEETQPDSPHQSLRICDNARPRAPNSEFQRRSQLHKPTTEAASTDSFGGEVGLVGRVEPAISGLLAGAATWKQHSQ